MTRDKISAYLNSTSYIIHSNSSFEYAFYVRNFCKGMTRDQVRSKFEKELEEAQFHFDAANVETTNWIQEQLQNNFSILNAEEVDEFWMTYNDRQEYYRKLSRQAEYQKELDDIVKSSRAVSSRTKASTASPSPSHHDHDVVEGDSLIFFDGRSIASILKSHGKKLFVDYQNLSDEEKALCGFCLDGILDLSNNNESGQKQLFTNDQWEYLNKHLGSKVAKRTPKLSDTTKKRLEEIIGKIKDEDEEESYYMALESIRDAHPNDKWMFKVVSHVINSYRERSYIFNNPTSDVSELDFMIKLWGEVLELLIGDDKNLFMKWGETSTDTTTAVRRSNNNNRPHTIGCKVDGRIVCQVSKNIDTCHIESARASASYRKVNDDKFKLAAEAKCTIDDIVTSGKLFKERSVCLQSLQIFGLQANVCTLHLLDRGFYVNCVDHDISLHNSLKRFSDDLITWIRHLALLKKNCRSIASLSSQAYHNQPATLPKMFNLQDSDESLDKYCNKDRVTGIFLPSTSTGIFFPKQFLTVTSSVNRSNKKDYPKSYLDDGTEVVSIYNKMSKKKRKHPYASSASSSSKKIHKN